VGNCSHATRLIEALSNNAVSIISFVFVLFLLFLRPLFLAAVVLTAVSLIDRSQNASPTRSQPQSGFPSYMSQTAIHPSSGFDSTNYFDSAVAAKQMAAFNDPSRVHITNSRSALAPGGALSSGQFLASGPSLNQQNNNASSIGHDPSAMPPNFQLPNHPHHAIPSTNFPLVDPSIAQSNMTLRPSQSAQNTHSNAQSMFLRQRNFLSGLANVMARRGVPLPPALTGIQSNFDPNNTPWKIIEPSPGLIGSFRLAGKDVDMYKLWGAVFQLGGGAKVCQGIIILIRFTFTLLFTA